MQRPRRRRPPHSEDVDNRILDEAMAMAAAERDSPAWKSIEKVVWKRAVVCPDGHTPTPITAQGRLCSICGRGGTKGAFFACCGACEIYLCQRCCGHYKGGCSTNSCRDCERCSKAVVSSAGSGRLLALHGCSVAEGMPGGNAARLGSSS